MNQDQHKNLDQLFHTTGHNPLENLSDIFQQYDYFSTYKFCQKQVPLTIINSLIQHYFECKQTNQLSQVNQVQDQEKNIQPYHYAKNEFCDELLDEQSHNLISFIESIFKIGNLSDGSKTLYQTSFFQLLQCIPFQDLRSITTKEFTHIAQHQCKSLNQANALIRLQKFLQILQSNEFRETIKLQKRLINECVEKRPHWSWNLNLIKKFLDDLFKYRRGFLAFRLFELAARISDYLKYAYQRHNLLHSLKINLTWEKGPTAIILDKMVLLQTQNLQKEIRLIQPKP